MDTNTTQKPRLQVQEIRRDGDVSFGMRGGLSDCHQAAGVGYHCTRAAVVGCAGGHQLRFPAWRCPTPTAAADGGEQHAAPAPDTPPGQLCFLQVRRRHPEKELGQ